MYITVMTYHQQENVNKLLHNPTTHYIFFAMCVNFVRLFNTFCQLWFYQNYDFTLLSIFSRLKSMFLWTYFLTFEQLYVTLQYLLHVCEFFSYVPNILTTIGSLNNNPSHHKLLIFIILSSFGIPRHFII